MAVSPEPPAVVASRAKAGIVAAVCATGTGSPLVTAVSTCVQVNIIFNLNFKMCIFVHLPATVLTIDANERTYRTSPGHGHEKCFFHIFFSELLKELTLELQI